MAERAHPDLIEFRNSMFGLKKNPYRAKMYERYLFCNKYIKNKVICDIPCGTGWGTSILKSYNKVVGIDIAKDAIDYANNTYSNNKRKFIIGNMNDIPLEENSIEVMLCLEGFEHIKKEDGISFLEEAKRVLVKDGLIIITCPVLNEFGNKTDNPYHLHEYDEEELINLFNEKFRIGSLDRIIGPDSPIYRVVASNIKNQRYTRLED